MAAAIFHSLNRARRAHGLHTLHWNSYLASAAANHAAYMYASNTLYTLGSVTDMDAIAQGTGIAYSQVGSSVAYTEGGPDDAVDTMVNGRSRNTVLSQQYTDVGTAEYGIFYCVVLLARRNAPRRRQQPVSGQGGTCNTHCAAQVTR